MTFTVPENYRRMARSYVEYGGFTGVLPAMLHRFYRRFHFNRRAAAHQDVFDIVSGVRGGSGWSPCEAYRGGTFRWCNPEGEILLPPANGNSCTLLLQIEPGPGVGHKPFELLVKNQKGDIVARHVVKRLSFLQLSVPRLPMRLEIFRLCAANGGIKGHRDPRILNFRLFWCGVKSTSRGSSLGSALFVHPTEGTGRVPVSIKGCVELIVAAPTPLPRALYLNIAAQPEPIESITIRDSFTGFHTSYCLRASKEIALELPLQPGGLAVFQIELAPPQSIIRSAAFSWLPQAKISSPSPRLLHTNACGDFTLLSRDKWFELRAYPEFDLFSMNIDSVFCYAAHHGGAEEEVLPDPMRIYHIEHGTGSGWTPEGEAALFERIRAKGMTFVSYAEVIGWAAQMRRLDCPFIFNRENWGLAEFDLPESKISQ